MDRLLLTALNHPVHAIVVIAVITVIAAILLYRIRLRRAKVARPLRRYRCLTITLPPPGDLRETDETHESRAS